MEKVRKGLIILDSQLKKVIGSILLFLSCSCLFNLLIYADKYEDYSIENSEIEILFESEQKILESYEINTETEDIPSEVVFYKLENTENTVEKAETLICEMIENIKIVEFEEEFMRNNKLAYREIDSIEDVYIWPVEGYTRVSSPYGWRICPFHGKELHTGVDIPAPAYTTVKATKGGVVKTAKYHSSYGNYVVLSHNDGTTSLYAHLVSSNVSVGQTVSRGQKIGGVGTTGSSTGNHLHFEIWTNSTADSHVNPMNYF